jgi:hypothetical protein
LADLLLILINKQAQASIATTIFAGDLFITILILASWSQSLEKMV